MTDPPPDQAGDELQIIGRGGSRGLTLPAIVVVIGVLLAIFKPWGTALPHVPDDGSSTGIATSSTPTRVSPGPTPDVEATSPARELERVCASPSGWRLSTLQVWSGRARPIRSWAVVEPVEAFGPTDMRIPIIPVAADRITAIGYCAPVGSDRPPVSAKAELYTLDDSGAHLLSAIRVEPRVETSMGVLWAPNPRAGRRDPLLRRSWADGVYVIHISDPTGYFDRWLGGELRITRAE